MVSFRIGKLTRVCVLVFSIMALPGLIQLSFAQDLDVREVGSYRPSNADITALTIGGNYAYVFNGAFIGHELTVLDISDPTNPRKVGGLGLDVVASKIVLDQNRLYLACGWDGLIIIDVREPTIPREIGRFDTSGTVTSVAVQGNRVFLTDAWGSGDTTGLLVIDPADPKNISVTATNRSVNALSIAVSANRIFAGYVDFGLQVIGPADSSHPFVRGSFETGGKGFGVAVRDNYAYLADGNLGLSVFDVSEDRPKRIAQYTGWTARDVVIVGNRAYVTRDYLGLEILDINNPEQPRRIGSYVVSAEKPAVAATGIHAFLAAGREGLLVLETALPSAIHRVGELRSINAGEVLAAGNTAYVAAGATGIVALDISIPTNPRQSGAFAVWTPRAMQIDGNVLYVSGEYGDLAILDVSVPGRIGRLGGYKLCPGCHAGAMSLVGRDLLILNPAGHEIEPDMTFNILDVTNPVFPTLIGGWDASGSTPGLATFGNIAYVAGRRSRPDSGTFNVDALTVIDFSDPHNPGDPGFLELPGTPLFAKVTGNQLYVGVWWSELLIFDISNPVTPKRIASLDVRGVPAGVSVRNPYAYVAASEAGLVVVDISDPAQPIYVTGNSAFRASSVAIAGNHLLVGAGEFGFQVLELFSPPTRLSGKIENGVLKLTVAGPPKQTLRVQRAWNATGGWQDWRTIAPANGIAEVFDPDFSAQGQAFYRTIRD